MFNVMFYNLGLSNASDEMKHNISTVYRFAEMIILFVNNNDITIK